MQCNLSCYLRCIVCNPHHKTSKENLHYQQNNYLDMSLNTCFDSSIVRCCILCTQFLMLLCTPCKKLCRLDKLYLKSCQITQRGIQKGKYHYWIRGIYQICKRCNHGLLNQNSLRMLCDTKYNLS